MMVKTAVIMAAGKGTRFGSTTKDIPKGFVPFSGKPMIVRSIETLRSCGIERIILGTGCHHEVYDELAVRVPSVECCFSERFAETNSAWTLWNCRNAIGNEPFLLLESDLIFEKKAISVLLERPEPDILLAAGITKFQDNYFIERDANENLTRCSVCKKDISACGELVGIHKIGQSFYRHFCECYSAVCEQQPKLGYEFVLEAASKKIPLKVLLIDPLKWYEIDDAKDLEYAEKNIRLD